MRDLIARARRSDIERALEKRGCALLIGARQVGKTELARMLEMENGNGAVYRDLEQPNQAAEVKDLEVFRAKHRGKLIILDEAQCLPQLFPQLRAILDQRDNSVDPTRWLLLGSAAAELTRLAAQLGGRIAIVELHGFQLAEVATQIAPTWTATTAVDVAEQAEQQASTADTFDIQQQLWLRGGYPIAFLSNDIGESLDWRRDYLTAFLDPVWIPEGLLQMPELVRPMWELLAIQQGEPMILYQAAMRLGCKVDVVRDLLAYLSSMRLVRELRPWFRNEGKRINKPARYFIRDSGLLHENGKFATIDNLRANPLCGKSWEGFVLEALSLRKPSSAELYFYRNDKQQEIDVVVDFGTDRRWAIEVKLGDDTAPTAGFHAAADEVAAERAFVINGGRESIDADNGKVPILCLSDALELLRQS